MKGMLGILRFFRRRAVRRGAPGAYSPLHVMLNLWLRDSHANGVTAFVFGTPRDVTPEAAADAIAYVRACEARLAERIRPVIVANSDEATRRAVESSGWLRCANGLQYIPFWRRVGGTLYPAFGLHVRIYPATLGIIADKLVSLDASVEAGAQPRRFLEYDLNDGSPERWLAEVELWFDDDNTVRLEILGHRRKPTSGVL